MGLHPYVTWQTSLTHLHCACLCIFFHSPASWGLLAVGHAEWWSCCGSSRSVGGRTTPPHSGRWGKSSLNRQHRRRHSKGPMSSVHASTEGFTVWVQIRMFYIHTESDINTDKKLKSRSEGIARCSLSQWFHLGYMSFFTGLWGDYITQLKKSES